MYPWDFFFPFQRSPSRTDCPGKDHNLTWDGGFVCPYFRSLFYLLFSHGLFPLSSDGAWMDQVWSIIRRRDRRVTKGVAWRRLGRLLGVGVFFFFTAQHFNTPRCFFGCLGGGKCGMGYEHLSALPTLDSTLGQQPLADELLLPQVQIYVIFLSLPGWMSGRAEGEEENKRASSV